MIREATATDRPAVRALQERALASPAPELLDLAFESVAATALVDEDEDLLGYALALPGDPTADPTVVYLAEIVVAPDARREGRGSALLDALADRFPEYDELRLTARATDEGALGFYRENGFWTLADLPDHFEDGDGVLLVRDL